MTFVHVWEMYPTLPSLLYINFCMPKSAHTSHPNGLSGTLALSPRPLWQGSSFRLCRSPLQCVHLGIRRDVPADRGWQLRAGWRIGSGRSNYPPDSQASQTLGCQPCLVLCNTHKGRLSFRRSNSHTPTLPFSHLGLRTAKRSETNSLWLVLKEGHEKFLLESL